MTHFLNAFTFLFVITPFSQGCTTKLMEGKDKDENKKEIILLLRKVADMLEELEDPIVDNVDPHLKVDEWGRVKYVEKPLMNADKYQVPSNQSTPVPSTQSTPVPRSPKGGHPPFFGIDVVDYEIPDVGIVGIPDDEWFAGCPLSDLGSPDGCGARMAKGINSKCKYLWKDQIFAPLNYGSILVQGIKNPQKLDYWSCQDLCLENPYCEGVNMISSAYDVNMIIYYKDASTLACNLLTGIKNMERTPLPGSVSLYCKPVPPPMYQIQ